MISSTYSIFNYYRSVTNNNAIHVPTLSRPEHFEIFAIYKLDRSNMLLMETEDLSDMHFVWIKYWSLMIKRSLNILVHSFRINDKYRCAALRKLYSCENNFCSYTFESNPWFLDSEKTIHYFFFIICHLWHNCDVCLQIQIVNRAGMNLG